MMKLKKLLKSLPPLIVKGSKEIEITGICAHSKRVSPGNLFIAKRGLTHDGGQFIAEAVAAGAVAVLTDIYDPFLEGVVQMIHPDVAAIEGELAKHYYHSASDALLLVGITGTNGKTTSAYLVRHLLQAAGLSTGLVGTISWIIGEQELPTTHTTPDLLTNHKLFYEMVQKGCSAAVMEVSSHGLDQGRVAGLDFQVALFTNLTAEHLDYHGTMEAYAAAKAKLFSSMRGGWAVVNADSPWTERVVQGCGASLLRYGIAERADLRAEELQLSARGSRFLVRYKEECCAVAIPLVGRFNVYNALGALGVGIACGYTLAESVEYLRSFKGVPGRLERVPNRLKLDIFVDFAHTEDALSHVLQTLGEFKRGRIITLFGCGGDRDRAKRPRMAAVAEKLSDLVVVTTDNPRQEDPEAIIREVCKGFVSPGGVVVEPDRKRAIEKAVDFARPDDILLIAGKGHETYQLFAHKRVEFDDRKVAQEACEKRIGACVPPS